MISPKEYSASQWQKLKELRQTFLAEGDARALDYWSSPELLTLYDETFAQRIGWKWAQVLDEISPKWTLAPTAVVDFGCGTGIALRQWLQKYPATEVPLYLLDRSAKAMEFARTKILELNPTATVRPIKSVTDIPERALILASHVANELPPELRQRFHNELARSAAFVWVEPGTKALARQIGEVRQALGVEFHWLAPCPHQTPCGLLAPQNAAHWCHHFAKPPREIFGSGFWKKFSDNLKIDLRSLPTSYLVGVRTEAPPAGTRVVGRARVYKGYAKALVCDAAGVAERRILSRHFPDTVERLEAGRFAESLDPKEWER